MIICFSDGRLGNQLFQFAFLVKHSAENELILTTNMGCLLETFETPRRIRNIQNRYIVFLLRKLLKPLLRLAIRAALVTSYQQERRMMGTSCRLINSYRETRGLLRGVKISIDNFFQAEEFFDVETLRDVLQVKARFREEAEAFLSRIPAGSHRVFVHVRRGDYVSEVFLGLKGIDLPVEYFKEGIKRIAAKVRNPYFIFLSDDVSFCDYCFSEIEPRIVSGNSMQTDFAIMTLCNSGVISNSSFAWWGAYFMTDREIVVAPKYWWGWKQGILSHPAIYPSFSEVLDPVHERRQTQGEVPSDASSVAAEHVNG